MTSSETKWRFIKNPYKETSIRESIYISISYGEESKYFKRPVVKMSYDRNMSEEQMMENLFSKLPKNTLKMLKKIEISSNVSLFHFKKEYYFDTAFCNGIDTFLWQSFLKYHLIDN